MTKLYEASNHILIHAGYANPAEHSHMAAHIIISIDDKMGVKLAEAEYLCHGVMIPSGTPHTIDTHGKSVLVFLYDCTTETASQIHSIRCVSEECCKSIVELYSDLERNFSTEKYRSFEQCVLAQFGIAGSRSHARDERIVSAMDYIRFLPSERMSCQEVADAVHLSQGRFSHLFREQTGMTFAAYLVYRRMMRVYADVIGGRSITDAALEAGFSSSAHFADTNRRLFGISASAITRDLELIRVS